MSRLKHNDFADVLTAAMRSGSTARFFDALDAVDRKAGYRELMDSITPAPSTFALCRCGSQLAVADSRIVLGPMERHAAADAAAARYGMKASDSDVYYHQVQVIIDAINAHREQADRDFVADWNTAHLDCGIDL